MSQGARTHEEDDIERLSDEMSATKQNSADATIIIGEVLNDITMNEAEMQNVMNIRQTECAALEAGAGVNAHKKNQPRISLDWLF